MGKKLVLNVVLKLLIVTFSDEPRLYRSYFGKIRLPLDIKCFR